jgi:hypothetical protein
MNKILTALVVTILIAGSVMAATFPTYGDSGTKRLTVVATNGATIGLNAKEIVLNAYGSATGETNSITITGAFYIDDLILLRVPATCTNKVLIADSTTVMDLDSNVVLAAGDTLLVKPTGTNTCVKVAATSQILSATVSLTLQKVSLTDTNGVTASVVTNASGTVSVSVP